MPQHLLLESWDRFLFRALNKNIFLEDIFYVNHVKCSSLKTLKLYLSVVRAHRSTASVWVGEMMPLIMPRPDKFCNGLVPVTSITHQNIHQHTVHAVQNNSVYGLEDWRAHSEYRNLHYRPEVIDKFWPMYFMACVGPWSQMHFEAQESANLARPSSQSCHRKDRKIEELLISLFPTRSKISNKITSTPLNKNDWSRHRE